MIRIFDSTVCILGEGPLWHPTRMCLFWFDILSNRLYLSEKDKTQHWEFLENVSAAGHGHVFLPPRPAPAGDASRWGSRGVHTVGGERLWRLQQCLQDVPAAQ